MRKRASSLGCLLGAVVVVACAQHKAEPPDGITTQNAGTIGNGMASDVESGTGQFGSTGPSAFAPVGFTSPDVGAWLAMMPETFVLRAQATVSAGSPTQTGAATPTPPSSPTPTPSAAPSVTPPASATPTPITCDVSALSLAVDADTDTFPDSPTTATFSSCELSSGLGGVAATGTLTVADDSAGSPAFSFHRIVNVGVTSGSASGTIQSTVTGTPAGAGVARIQQNAHLTLSTTTDTVQHASDWTLDFTPTAGAGWTAPWPGVGGTLSVNGTWGVTLNALNATAVVSTTTPLTIADPATCATRVTAGTLQAVFAPSPTNSKSHTLVVTWTACGQRTRTLDGTVVP